MASKFGGVPVDEQPTSKFGGVPVDAPAPVPPIADPNKDTTATANLWPHGETAHNFVYSPNGMIRTGLRQAGNGVHDLFNPGHRMSGAADILEGAGQAMLPAAIPAAIAAPLPAIGALIGGYAGGKGAKALMPASASPEATRLAEDVGSIPGAMLGGGVAGGIGKSIARPIMRSAMRLPSNESAGAVLEHTSGVRPESIAASARQEIGNATGRRNAEIGRATEMPSLAPSRQSLIDASNRMVEGNKEPQELAPMMDRLHNPVPGFPGSVDPSGELSERQNPMDFLRLRHNFGQDFTKFQYARPLTNPALEAGNEAYMGLTNELHRVAPGSAAEDQLIHNLIPAKEQGDLIAKQPGPIDRGVQRLTAKTGAMALPAMGFAAGGPGGAATAITIQELMADPTVRAALARRAHASFPLNLTPGLGLPAAGLGQDEQQ